MHTLKSFGSAKNFYCCRSVAVELEKYPLEVLRISTVVDYGHKVENALAFGSAKNFYCCRSGQVLMYPFPLEVLRISTVVDFLGES